VLVVKETYVRLSVTAIRNWSQRSTNRSILLAAAIVGSMTLIVKAAAFVKDLIVAHNFGVSRELDAYLIAFVLPQFAINVVAGAFHTSLVPTYIEVRDREGQEAAQELFAAVMARALLILLACAVLLAVMGPVILPVIGSGFDSDTLSLSRNMFFMTLPAVIISGMGVIWGAVLNAHDKFALAALAPLAVPVVTLLLVLLTYQTLGVYALALGLVLGFTIQAALLAWSLRQRNIKLRPVWHTPQKEAVRIVMQQFLPAAAGTIIASSTELVDQSMAASLGAGSVSALNYGMKLLSFVMGIGATALGIAVLPYFSKMVAERNWAKVKHTYKTYALLIIASTVPIVVIFTVFSEPIVRILYERGRFTPEDTIIVSQIQAALFLQMPFYLTGIMGVRLLSAFRKNQYVSIIALSNLGINIVANYIFSYYLGIVGIALSTSLVYVISSTAIWFVLVRAIKRASAVGSA
jgi:putative peptidoglycan lipid II flippase